MREKKYTRTVAIRVTDEEYALILSIVTDVESKTMVKLNPTDVIRGWLRPCFEAERLRHADLEKRKAAAERRAATKAAKQAQA